MDRMQWDKLGVEKKKTGKVRSRLYGKPVAAQAWETATGPSNAIRKCGERALFRVYSNWDILLATALNASVTGDVECCC